MITRTMVFTTLIAANIFLTLVNRSFYYSIATTILYKNNMVPAIIAVTITLTACFIFVKPFAIFFDFAPLTFSQLAISSLTGFISVIWFELVKAYKRRTRSHSDSQGIRNNCEFYTDESTFDLSTNALNLSVHIRYNAR